MQYLSLSTPQRYVSWPNSPSRVAGRPRSAALVCPRVSIRLNKARDISDISAAGHVFKSGKSPFDSKWGWRHWVGVLFCFFLLGCTEDDMKVAPPAEGGAFARQELLQAVEQFTKSDRSPAHFRQMALAINELKPRFNQVVAREAERHLVRWSLEPLSANFDQPLAQQQELLGLTVWPTALKVEPETGEDVSSYTGRLCAGPLSKHCKRVVPEYHSLVLTGLVWSRLADRAREAVRACYQCEGDKVLADVLSRFEHYHSEMVKRVGQEASNFHPRRWPTAGANATLWSGAPVLRVDNDGRGTFDERVLPPGSWREALTDIRDGDLALGLAMKPTATVAELRAVARDAAAAGFRTLAIQTRNSDYPYEMREYRISLKGMTLRTRSQRSLGLRDVDSVQTLVRALDASAGAGKSLPTI